MPIEMKKFGIAKTAPMIIAAMANPFLAFLSFSALNSAAMPRPIAANEANEVIATPLRLRQRIVGCDGSRREAEFDSAK